MVPASVLTNKMLCVAEWRCEEEQQINSSLKGAERKAALCALLEKETNLIADIGRHRIAFNSTKHDKTIRIFLEKVRVQRFFSAHR